MVRRVLDERGRRFEFRLPGADMNPYHAIAALLASGIHGVEEGERLPPPGSRMAGDAEHDRVPASLDEAISRFEDFVPGEEYFGSGVRSHLLGHAYRELLASRAVVTDWEWRRYFAEA